MAGLDPRLLQLASNEYLSEPQRMVVNALLQRQIAQAALAQRWLGPLALPAFRPGILPDFTTG